MKFVYIAVCERYGKKCRSHIEQFNANFNNIAGMFNKPRCVSAVICSDKQQAEKIVDQWNERDKADNELWEGEAYEEE